MRTILVVDDEDCVREVIREMLEQSGYRVVEAKDAEGGMQVAGEENPDLVLMDYKLPERNGQQALEELHGTRPDLPVVFITGMAKEEFWTGSVSAKAAGYLLKPFSRNELLATMDVVLNRRRAVGVSLAAAAAS
jgi:CheY-like chemotaxis protein